MRSSGVIQQESNTFPSLLELQRFGVTTRSGACANVHKYVKRWDLGCGVQVSMPWRSTEKQLPQPGLECTLISV
jgi:hypothetical protein